MKKSFIIMVLIFIIPFIVSCDNSFNKKNINDEEKSTQYKNKIVIKDIDGTNYEFTYNNENYKVVYTYDHWKIYDSYKINNIEYMKNICQALIDINPIHGKDRVSYRTVDDMVYEWLQHNIAYKLLPDDNKWKDNAKDVDFDPDDQGKSIKEIYENRTGGKFDISSMLK